MDIGRQVAAEKNVMVFYPFKKESKPWPSMFQIMNIICDEGDIDKEKDTAMHYGGMDE
jgi:hypothetical protein